MYFNLWSISKTEKESKSASFRGLINGLEQVLTANPEPNLLEC